MNYSIGTNSDFIKMAFKKGMNTNEEEETPPWLWENNSRGMD